LSLLPIYLYGQQVLRKKAKAIKTVDADLVRLAHDMIETMHTANGIGLAANQVGSLQRIIVVDVSESTKEREDAGDLEGEDVPREARSPVAMINPVVVLGEGERVMEEGCLSIPDIREEVERLEAIQVKYRDLKMQERELFADGLLARVILHEIDHLDGVLFIDHIGKMKQKLMRGRLNKVSRGEVEIDYPFVADAVPTQ
jgi:peptide deformylase